MASMPASSRCLAQLGRMCLTPRTKPNYGLSCTSLVLMAQVRFKSRGAKAAPMLSKAEKEQRASKGSAAAAAKKKKEKRKKKQYPMYRQWDLKDADQFSLCDAIRYIRAFEVGEIPNRIKYEIHLKLKSLKNSPVVRNRLRLPYPVKTDVRVCVICDPESKYAASAQAAGAVLVGEDSIFEAVKDGRIEFDACICQSDSLAKMNKAGMGRILGPKGLMPSAKLGTVVKDPAVILRDMISGSEYRERTGVVRMAVGQLGFTPEELSRNIKAFIDAVKKDMAQLSDKTHKDLAEVVLSASHSPGFSLNGYFGNPESNTSTRELSTS